jgi:hypothetical protein
MIDWNDIATLISALGTGVVALILLPQKLKNANLDNDGKAAETWRKLYDEKKAECDRKDSLIEELYSKNDALRDENNGITTENAKLTLLRCKTLGCDKRVPPFGTSEEEKKNLKTN